MTDKTTILAAAQFSAEDEDIAYNLKAHYRLIQLAAKNNVQLLVFPEMSITGYVREKAARLAFLPSDPRLSELIKLSAAHRMTIIVGAPVRIGSALHIGSFIISPDQTVSLYTKQFLYKNETDFFMSNCGNNPLISVGQEQLSCAICFDMENIPHIKKAKAKGSTVYAPSIFYSKAAIDDAHNLLSSYAKTYALNVLMSNYCGHLYHTPAGGKSAFWSAGGEQLACLPEDKAGLVIAAKENEAWKGRIVVDA